MECIVHSQLLVTDTEHVSRANHASPIALKTKGARYWMRTETGDTKTKVTVTRMEGLKSDEKLNKKRA